MNDPFKTFDNQVDEWLARRASGEDIPQEDVERFRDDMVAMLNRVNALIPQNSSTAQTVEGPFHGWEECNLPENNYVRRRFGV